MDAVQLHRALTSNRTVRFISSSSKSSSVRQTAYRVTTTMKDVWDHVKSGNGNVLESWNTTEMKKGETKFMNSLATFETLSVLCHACHERHFAKNTAQVQAKVCPKCVYDPNHVKKRDRRVVMANSNLCYGRGMYDFTRGACHDHWACSRCFLWYLPKQTKKLSEITLLNLILFQ